MPKLTPILSLFAFILTCSFISVNTNFKKENVSKASVDTLNWIGLLETPTEVEVLYAYDTCNEQKKLLLKYFNEMPQAQTIKFKITLRYTGYIIEEEKTKSLNGNQVITGDCSSSDGNLFVLIPPQWKLDQVNVTADLIEVTQQ